MIENEAPAAEAETESAGISEILEGSSAPAPQKEQPKAEAAPAAEAATPEVKPETPAPEAHPFYFRKAIEKEKKERARLERELEQLRQAQPQQHLPDPRQDPVSYYETQRVFDRLERSEDRFIDKHGEPELEAVKDWLTTRPDIEAWAIQQRHPWAAAHQQYQREKLSAEIGDDPNAWREAERERLRAEILAEMPSAPMAPPRPNIPAPASGQRSAAPRNSAGQFAGPTPLGDIIGKR